MSDELATVVGERIRRLRLEVGLGLRELAREIGIARSALSALENHRGGMSIACRSVGAPPSNPPRSVPPPPNRA